MKKSYLENIHGLINSLDSDEEKGLSSSILKSKEIKYGPNELQEEKGRSFFSKLLGQFSDFLVIILIITAVISFIVGERKDAIVIIAIVIVNALLGLYQEGRAEKALDALKKMSSPFAKVIRDGSIQEIDSRSLVPGDIVLLETGDIIPADIRLIESSNLKVEEASLTGESLPVEKNANTEFTKEIPLGDRVNMVYMSTIITYGRAKGIVVGTGHNTEIGKIATMIQSYEEENTPLQNQLNQLGKFLGITTIIISMVIFAIGIFQGREVLDMFMASISLAVAAIPEGLPAIVTIVLAIGMNKMVKNNAIVKKLLAVETLGSTTVICSDKTGTLTQNEMTVVKAFTSNKIIHITGNGYNPEGDFLIDGNTIDPFSIGDLETLSIMAALVNDASIQLDQDDNYKVIGDPTEGSLISFSQKTGIYKEDINKEFPRIGEIPFDSHRKMMTSFHENFLPDKVIAFTKGAPDIILDRCSKISTEGQVLKFTDERKKEVLKINSEFSRLALRVLAFSYSEYDQLPENPTSDEVEKDMTFVGLVGMIDPARPEAKDSIALCKKAGIKTVMITGDYKETAFAIGKELGMVDSIDQAMMGSELDNLSDSQLREVVDNVKVYARVSPEHKVRIIEALKANGEITSMTGDGVNDALALKKADIGVAMGITGTDVAKNTADLILTDDNFSSIVKAVEEGRVIYSNIKKFVFFLLSCNIGEIFLVLSSILLNLPLPLLPIQLLWLNLVTDSFPALALGVEDGEEDIMNRPPRNPKDPILNGHLMIKILIQSISIAAVSLFAFKWGLKYYNNNLLKARTITFTTLILAELLRSFSSRSQHHTLFKIGFFTNKTLTLSTGLALALLLAVLYIPFLQPIFETFSLGFTDWSVVIPLGFIPLIIGELGKIFIKEN